MLKILFDHWSFEVEPINEDWVINKKDFDCRTKDMLKVSIKVITSATILRGKNHYQCKNASRYTSAT